jgi:hypothetical protein
VKTDADDDLILELGLGARTSNRRAAQQPNTAAPHVRRQSIAAEGAALEFPPPKRGHRLQEGLPATTTGKPDSLKPA